MIKKASLELSLLPSKISNTVIKVSSPQYMQYMTRRELSWGINCGVLDIPPQESFRADFRTQNTPLEFIFCLRGSSLTRFRKNGRLYEFDLSQGECGIFHAPDAREQPQSAKKKATK